jgi:hypothetical protein
LKYHPEKSEKTTSSSLQAPPEIQTIFFFYLMLLGSTSLSISPLKPPGHGRKRRAIDHEDKNLTEYTKFKENLQYTVLMPGDFSKEVKYRESGDQCRNFVMISGLLAGLLALSTIIVSCVEDFETFW